MHILSDLEKRPKNILKTTAIDICSVTSLGRPQGVNLIIIQRICVREFFLYFLISSVVSIFPDIRHCSAKISQKPNTFYFGSIMVQDVSTKIEPTSSGRCVLAGQKSRCLLSRKVNYCHLLVSIENNMKKMLLSLF